MLNELHGPVAEAPGRMEKCKPDYERLIGNAKEKLKKTENLFNATLEYIGYRTPRNKLAEMIGELFCEKRDLEDTIDRLIKEQEESGPDS